MMDRAISSIELQLQEIGALADTDSDAGASSRTSISCSRMSDTTDDWIKKSATSFDSATFRRAERHHLVDDGYMSDDLVRGSCCCKTDLTRNFWSSAINIAKRSAAVCVASSSQPSITESLASYSSRVKEATRSAKARNSFNSLAFDVGDSLQGDSTLTAASIL